MRIVLITLFLIGTFFSSAQKPFHFQNITLQAGTKHHFLIPITTEEGSTRIPVTVFHGLKPGPTLGITAGIHGFGYPPIIAAQKINNIVNPKELSGTIIMVQLANVSSFLKRSPYVNPIDGKNLNRSFPGDANGTITERIAHIITNEVISKSDYFMDIHAGDAPEDLIAYNAWYQCEALPEASKKGKDMALAMGFDYAVTFKIPNERLKSPSIYCSQEAFHRNIPSIDIECGRLGTANKIEINRIVDGVFLLLNHLDMLRSEVVLPVKTPLIIADRYSIKSTSTGIFYSDKKAGDTVSKDEHVGYITDFFGNKLEDVHASQDGMILYMLGTPPINKGETIMSVGILP